MNKITTKVIANASTEVVTHLGIDLAKNVFAIHGINAAGKTILVKPTVRRDQLLGLLAQLPPCIIGMEACTGAHHWARLLIKFGHTPKLMAPKFVIPYSIQGKCGKNDANDAAAICEAVGSNRQQAGDGAGAQLALQQRACRQRIRWLAPLPADL